MIYWIDDDRELLSLVHILFGCCGVHTIPHWSAIPSLKEGDLVICDYEGVGERPADVFGVEYLVCSGALNIKKDFNKPPPWKEIAPIIHSKMAKDLGCELKRAISVYRHRLGKDLCVIRGILENMSDDNPDLKKVKVRLDKICENFKDLKDIELGKGKCYKA